MSDKFTGTTLIYPRRLKSEQTMQICRWLFTESLALQAIFHECAVTGRLVNPQSMCTLLLSGILVAFEMQERNTNEYTHCSKVLHSFPLPYVPEGASLIYSGKMTQVNKLKEPQSYLKLGGWPVMICQTNLTARNRGFLFHQPLFSV